MKASDYIAEFLHAQGVRQVFEVIGGMTTHLVDSLAKHGRIQIVSVHHEQAAAFAAEGLARMTGVPGVAMATSGPGATNLLTGIGSCYFDSYPAVFITGQVNRHEQKGTRAIRQLGFQETDIVAMAKPITKAAHKIDDPAELPAVLADAFKVSLSGRPGPVLIDVPMDVQRAQVTGPVDRIERDEPRPPARQEVTTLLASLSAAQRPLILVGGGVRSGRAAESFRRFVDALGVPVVNSLMAVDALPYEHPLRVGLIGSYGNRWGNLAIHESDWMLVVGSRLDVRQTGSDPSGFAAGKTIFHVDVEPGEINNRVTGVTGIVSDLEAFFTATLECQIARQDRSEWLGRIAELRRQWPDTEEDRSLRGINPNRFMHLLSKHWRDVEGFVADVGQHQMWAAQSLELTEGQRFLNSGGMGAMGFGLPAAIGAAFAEPRKTRVALIAGDGGFQLNIQELQTVVRNRLPMKIVILNNQCHGMVRQFQQSYFDQRYQSTMWGYSAPDFAVVAAAYGLKSTTISTEEEVEPALRLLAEAQEPVLLQVMIDPMTNAYPKLAFGRGISDMEPLVAPIEMEST